MLKYTNLFNFGLAGALIVPSIKQQLDSPQRIEQSLRTTESAISALETIETDLAAADYSAVERILASTEAPFGGERERSTLLDNLRREIGELNAKVEHIDNAPLLPHLSTDPTASLDATPNSAVETQVATTGLSDEGRAGLGNIWPPIVGGSASPVRTEDDRDAFEPEGFTVDAVLQGRAYYRAKRYEEALTLLRTRSGEPQADYWIGRTYERLGRTREAIASYTAVVNNTEATPAEADRAKRDREFLGWLVDFDRKVKDLRGPEGEDQ
jgi:tetratricopeptide (TPR) repeat protein